MRKIIASLLLVVGVTAYAALPGTTCYNPIALGDNYSEQITGPFDKTIWYTAWTYDLPLTVYFIPENQSDPAPEIYMDFGCTPGVYSDPLLCMLFCKGSSSMTLEMPHKPTLQTSQAEGKFCYYISMGKAYRDLLLKVGIDYNVQVFVKVIYHAPGKISMAPDDMFSNCMDGQKFMHFGDTVRVKTRDKDRHVIVPYVQWQEDSIRYVWDGTDPVEVAVGNDCRFDPTDGTSENRVDYFVLQPKDTLKMTSAQVKYYIQSDDVSSEAGMFYAKFYTNGTGTMKIERVPQDPPKGGATLLRYDRQTAVSGDTTELFAIPYTWTTATLFTTPTDHVFRMYVSTKPDFELKDALATYQFSQNDAGHWLGLTDAQMQALWANTKEQYLYVRFECTAKTTITPSGWAMSPCLSAAKEIKRPSTTVVVAKGSYGAVYYRFYYREWQGGDMTFDWQSVFSTCPTFIGDTCKFNTNSSAAQVITNKTINQSSQWTIPAATVAKWEKRVDDDGYLYIRFNPGSQGTMVISTTAPEEVDPAPITYPAATISVLCDGEPTAAGQAYTVRVSVEQDLSLYPGDPAEMGSRTPLETWHQTAGTTHALVLESGVYTLKGIDETIRVVVK